MKKRIIPLLLAICLLACLLPMAVMATGTTDPCANGHHYANGKCRNCGYQKAGPAAPVVVVETASNGKFSLKWEAVDGANQYLIYRSFDGSSYSLWKWTNSWTTYCSPSNSDVGTSCYYKVRAQDQDGAYSKYSNVVQAVYRLAQPKITVKADNSTGKIKISWGAVTGATKYKVYRSLTGRDGSWNCISTTTKTAISNSKNTVPGVRYYYKVMAIAQTPEANSAYSATKSCIYTLAQPVVTLSYDAAKNGVRISWDPVEGATQYKVYRSLTGEDGSWSRLSTTTKTTVLNTKNFDRSQKYYYKVIAIAENPDGNSPYSEVQSYIGKLAQPVVTVSNIASSGKIRISWDSVDGAVKYELYRSDSKNGNYSLLTTTKKTGINHTSAAAGETWYYKVVAVADDPVSNSDFSAPKGRTCDLPQPTTTAGLSTKGQPKLTWKAVDGAVSYKVYRADTKDGTYKLMKTTTSTSYTNTSAATYETYYYQVMAVAENSAANSAKSAAKGISSTSVNITPSKLSKDLVTRLNEYRTYCGLSELKWNQAGELACRTRAAEYNIALSATRPDGTSLEKIHEAGQIMIELGFQVDATAQEIVDTLMYYEDYEDYAEILLYEDWTSAVVAYNNGYWCIMFS